MKVKREMSSDESYSDKKSFSGSSVHNRLGRSWTRAENRLDKNSRWSKRESPRKVSFTDCLYKEIYDVLLINGNLESSN